jgi:hypothetical protein
MPEVQARIDMKILGSPRLYLVKHLEKDNIQDI